MPESATYTEPEPLSRAELGFIRGHLGSLAATLCDLHRADRTRGKAKVPDGRCLWTKRGCRITITSKNGCTVASVSKLVDPDAPAAGTFPED